MTGTEVDMAEKCKEHITSSTKICNGEQIQMNAERFGIVVTLIVMAVLLSIAYISQSNILFTEVETSGPTTFYGYCEKMNLKC